ncbi:MAG TPA: hypothetical protein VLL52_12035 [Anaerolineae bacterium]|nr:hypothetical protein [Anaerolineae bacterium]
MNTFTRLLQVELYKLVRHPLTITLLLLIILILSQRLNNHYNEIQHIPDLMAQIEAYQPPPPAQALTDTSTDASRQMMGAFMTVDSPHKYWVVLTYPGIFQQLWLTTDWLNIALILLAIIAVGNEFSWGTIRMAVMRGLPRYQIVLAKLFAMATIIFIYLIICWLFLAVVGFFLTDGLNGTVSWDFLTGSFWQTQILGLGRIWFYCLTFTTFVLAINLWIGNPGPAFTLLFVFYSLSLLIYVSLLILMTFALTSPDFVITEVKDSIWGWLIVLLPHYNGRLFIHWANPPLIANADFTVHRLATFLDLSTNPWRAATILLSYGLITLTLSLISFHRREL